MKEREQATILLDLDDTITHFMSTCIREYNKMYGTNHSPEDITEWEIDGIFEHDLWSVLAKTDILQHMPLKDKALEVIKEWHESGYKVVIVTGIRCADSYRDKLIWLKNCGLEPYIYDLIPTIHKELVKGDILIDDNPRYLSEWEDNNIGGIGLLVTANHNKGKSFDGRFIRVNDWQDIKEEVEIILSVKGKK